MSSSGPFPKPRGLRLLRVPLPRRPVPGPPRRSRRTASGSVLRVVLESLQPVVHGPLFFAALSVSAPPRLPFPRGPCPRRQWTSVHVHVEQDQGRVAQRPSLPARIGSSAVPFHPSLLQLSKRVAVDRGDDAPYGEDRPECVRSFEQLEQLHTVASLAARVSVLRIPCRPDGGDPACPVDRCVHHELDRHAEGPRFRSLPSVSWSLPVRVDARSAARSVPRRPRPARRAGVRGIRVWRLSSSSSFPVSTLGGPLALVAVVRGPLGASCSHVGRSAFGCRALEESGPQRYAAVTAASGSRGGHRCDPGLGRRCFHLHGFAVRVHAGPAGRSAVLDSGRSTMGLTPGSGALIALALCAGAFGSCAPDRNPEPVVSAGGESRRAPGARRHADGPQNARGLPPPGTRTAVPDVLEGAGACGACRKGRSRSGPRGQGDLPLGGIAWSGSSWNGLRLPTVRGRFGTGSDGRNGPLPTCAFIGSGPPLDGAVPGPGPLGDGGVSGLSRCRIGR